MISKWERIALISLIGLVGSSIIYGSLMLPHELRGGVYFRLGEIQKTVSMAEKKVDEYTEYFERRTTMLLDLERYRAKRLGFNRE